jgi:hypothetical protein
MSPVNFRAPENAVPMPQRRMNDDLFDRLRGEAEESADGDDDVGSFDVVGAAKGDAPVDGSPDLTFAGYVARHDRPPAFEGVDGQPYTVGVNCEETGEADRPWAAFLVFVRWASTGAGIVAFGATEEEARDAAMRLTLYDLKTELDAAIRRREADMES